MENIKDFILNISNWHLKDVVGLPEDGSYCFIIFGNTSKGYKWSVGGYSISEKLFYCNLGLGGMVVSENDVVAWKQWEEVLFDLVE
ncbi:hypothetical protein DW886_16260 [Enterocloster aldenensis]|uniref:hypothetical protein n=1 Tax=Enterocloster aldenensis TaxID=358742 RepID=UPI000E4A0DFE|nr:hypothetical protein DW886_16260 [Enterocloster aldenensis]